MDECYYCQEETDYTTDCCDAPLCAECADEDCPCFNELSRSGNF